MVRPWFTSVSMNQPVVAVRSTRSGSTRSRARARIGHGDMAHPELPRLFQHALMAAMDGQSHDADTGWQGLRHPKGAFPDGTRAAENDHVLHKRINRT
jgi:hypothetical protein